MPASPASTVSAEQPDEDVALTTAVDALRSTVEAMRAHVPRRSPTVSAAPVIAPTLTAPPLPRHPTAAEVRLAAVAEALAAERADVFLEPILGLEAEQASHFEIFVRLKDASGQPLARNDYAGDARGAGLLPLLDALNVRHSAGFALRLERRGRDGAVFTEVAGESLESNGFVAGVSGRFAQGIADRLVLSFSQDEAGNLGETQRAALLGLKRLGFRFALQGIAHLDTDLDGLKSVGFDFVKLDAGVFEQGLPFGASHVPAPDLCRHFAEHGLNVIVCHIDDELSRGRIAGYGVSLGQGALFGGPRPVPVGLDASAGAAA